MALNLNLDLNIAAPLLELNNSHSNSSNKFFTPIPERIKKNLFYTPLPDYKFDKRLSFLPTFKNTPSDKRKLKTEKLKKCEALARITLILAKYQKWIRKKKCIVQKWDIDSDSDSDSDSDYDSDSDSESECDSDNEMDEEEQMNLAIYQQMAYGNNSMIQKIKKNEVYNWINKELSKNYSESRLLEDYLHLLNEHKHEFEQIHNHLCTVLDKQIKPNDNFKETYIQYQSKRDQLASFNVEINIEKLLDEIQLHFGGIFDVSFFHQKYKVLHKIGSGIEGDVHKVKLRKQFDSFVMPDENDDNNTLFETPKKCSNCQTIGAASICGRCKAVQYCDRQCQKEHWSQHKVVCQKLAKQKVINNGGQSSSEDEDDESKENEYYYYAAKTIEYNERTMNNYRVMGKFEILDDFEMYLDKTNDKLILVSEFWDFDIFDYMKKYNVVFNENELFAMMNKYIIPLLMKLHCNCYIHGDIKPNNLVMNINEFGNEFGLIDFGTMLKMNELSETIRSSLIGSMGYYAPEIIFQMYNGPVKIDTKNDIWALGLTCIYLLIGTHPLINDDLNILGERKIKIKIQNCLNKMKKSKKISNDLFDLLNNMLQIKPIKRYNLYQIQKHKWCTKININKNNILFLSINGVLNNKKTKLKTIKPELIMKLKKIINLTQCFIVLIGEWRKSNELIKKFKKQFIKIVRLDVSKIYIGNTINNNNENKIRVHEIKEYLEDYKQKNNNNDVMWCVVDNMDLINENEQFKNECQEFLDEHWVQTNIDTGLNRQNVEKIVSILNGS